MAEVNNGSEAFESVQPIAADLNRFVELVSGGAAGQDGFEE